MNPLLQALFGTWEWRPFVMAMLVVPGLIYTWGWLQLRRRNSQLANGFRLASYIGGLLALALSLLSPIDWLGGQLFFMHMVQHLLSIMVAAPLLWLASPFPIILWGLPYPIRRQASLLLASPSIIRKGLALITAAPIAWFLFIGIYLGWHEPALYNLALRREGVHDVEHITFFLGAMLFWWHVIGGAPHIHKRMPSWGRAAFALAAIPPNMIAGVTISFASSVIYTYYESVPRIWGIDVLTDQRIGGAIMWIPGSMMFLVAAVLTLGVGLYNTEKAGDGAAPAHPELSDTVPLDTALSDTVPSDTAAEHV